MNVKRSCVRRALVIALTGLLGGSCLQAVAADPPVNQRIQSEITTVLRPLRDSEAEVASGGYFPGIGAVFTLELVRGPNDAAAKPTWVGVRDWVTYLMTAFGPLLAAVPVSETIAMNVDYYDYADDLYHQFTVTSRAGSIADPTSYLFWLDGVSTGDVGAVDTATAAAAGDAARATNTPEAAFNSTALATALIPTPATPLPRGPVHVLVTFDDATALTDWLPVAGTWSSSGGTYEQTELRRFDLLSYFNRPVAGDVTISADIKFVQGVMGAGLVFNAPQASTKSGANMVSFAANGSYIQWGAYDSYGVFQFAGGATLASNVADGAWHHLIVVVTRQSYSVALDGVELGTAVPISGGSGGFAGLLASTSDVQFDNVAIESAAP